MVLAVSERPARNHLGRARGDRPRTLRQASSRHEALALVEDRRARTETRLGGTGDPLDAITNLRETPYTYGIPWSWRQEGQPYTRGVPISDTDPPMFESEATYLARLGLLDPGERKRIPRIDFEPEVIRVVDGYIG